MSIAYLNHTQQTGWDYGIALKAKHYVLSRSVLDLNTRRTRAHNANPLVVHRPLA